MNLDNITNVSLAAMADIAIRISKIEVLHTDGGMDHIIIHTSIPPCYPWDKNLTLRFKAPANEGRSFVEKVFPGTSALVREKDAR